MLLRSDFRWSTAAGVLVTALLVLFLVLPMTLSISAGLSVNYARGLGAGLTLRWVGEVWVLYADTMVRSLLVAVATLAGTLVIGVPASYAPVRRGGQLSRIVEEIVSLPVAIPGPALALGLIITYGGYGAFRQSTVFIIVGHVLFTLPFMMRSVIAMLETIDWRTSDDSAASPGAGVWRRFFDVVLPNIRPGVLAGALAVVTLSIGEFNLSWMLHTPMTKTLPVGLADAYASMRLELASAYTLVFLLLIVPILLTLQFGANFSERRFTS
ncbi:ABC transporter permease subunit [Devosia sp. A8/3-2]|nr:ABC transporter permease subunit [Devosia sp. A8/3-2]